MLPRVPPIPLLLAVLLSATLARSAEYHVVGEVVDVVPALAPYGVVPGARVDVTWTVDLATPPSGVSPAPDNKTDYQGALDFLLIESGTWLALRTAPAQGQIDQGIVAVADDSGGSLDLLHIATPGTDNDLVLHGGGVLVLSLDFYGIDGNASSNQSLDQDPARYPLGVGSAIGANGYMTFRIGDTSGGGGSGDPTADCAAAQLGAAAKLCQTRFKCESGHAKDPGKDPLGERLEACVEAAEDGFTATYTRALLDAASDGLSCASTAPAVDARTALGARIAGVIDEVNAISPAHAPLAAGWLGAAGGACSGGFKAEAKNASKPDAPGLAAARARAKARLLGSAESALGKAAKAGVVFDPPADPTSFADAVDALVDETTSDLTAD